MRKYICFENKLAMYFSESIKNYKNINKFKWTYRNVSENVEYTLTSQTYFRHSNTHSVG